MKSSIRRWLHGSRLLLAGGFAILSVAVAAPLANAQSLTLSFAFDQGAATSTSAPLTTEHITSANNGQTYLVDIFATVTGTSGTALNAIGINNINFRGYASSVNTAAFTTASNGSVGVQNDANLQANSNSSSSSLQDSTPEPVISDGGSTASGSATLASGPGTSGVYGLPGTSNIGSDNFLVNFSREAATKWTVGGAAVSAYGTTVPSIATVNNPTEAGTPNAFQTRDSNGNLVAGSYTFLVGQFDYTIGTVSAATSQAQLTSFVPTVSSAAGSNKIANYTDTVNGSFSNSNTTRASMSGTTTVFSTGTSPYTIGNSLTWQVDAVAPSGNTSVIQASPATSINLGRMMQGALNSQLETVSLTSGNNTGATASVTGGTTGATLGSPNNGGSATASGANFISGSQSWTTTVSLTNNITPHSMTYRRHPEHGRHRLRRFERRHGRRQRPKRDRRRRHRQRAGSANQLHRDLGLRQRLAREYA